jgi:hypothetical protein
VFLIYFETIFFFFSVLDYCKTFITLDFILYYVYPCPVETLRGSICGFLILCLPFVFFRQKSGVFFVLERECIFKPVK